MVGRIQLKGDHIAFVDDEDEPRVREAGKWMIVFADTNRYAQLTGKPIPLHHRSLHRFVMRAKHDELYDHIDGNGLNNQKANLRLATHQQNCWNTRVSRSSAKTSRFKGVSGSGFTWTASITFHGTATNLGRFSSQEAAARAYDKAAIECFGEFAKTNEMMGLYEKAK
jgi:hypothetical protein